MKRIDLSKWMTVAANVGVLAGLIVVSYELNQNTKLARAALINDGNAFENALWADMMGGEPSDVIAMAVECPEQMTYADFMAMDAFLFTSMNIVYRFYEIAQEGLFTTSDWKTEVENYAHWYLGNEFGRSWWEKEGKSFFALEFSEHVDKQLASEAKDSFAYWQTVRSGIASVDGAAALVSRPCRRVD